MQTTDEMAAVLTYWGMNDVTLMVTPDDVLIELIEASGMATPDRVMLSDIRGKVGNAARRGKVLIAEMKRRQAVGA